MLSSFLSSPIPSSPRVFVWFSYAPSVSLGLFLYNPRRLLYSPGLRFIYRCCKCQEVPTFAPARLHPSPFLRRVSHHLPSSATFSLRARSIVFLLLKCPPNGKASRQFRSTSLESHL